MRSIEIVSIPVSDQESAKDFYMNKMGFKLIVEAPMIDSKWIQLGLESGATITLVTWFDNMPPGCINGLVIETDDIEKEETLLQSRGVETGKIDQTPWGRFMWVKDPDGNRLSLRQK